MGEWGDEEKSPFEALRVTGQAFVRTTDSSEHALMGAGARLAEAARVGSIARALETPGKPAPSACHFI